MIFGEHFEWDKAKEISNLAKHGVAFPEATAAFADVQRVILPDLAHRGTSHVGIALGASAILS